jgi:hypothetical protein
LNSIAYILFFYLISFALSFILFPGIWETPFNMKMACVGGAVGVLSVGVMLLTSNALKNGPTGLTFAMQNVSSVFPGLLLFMLFGEEYGFAVAHSHYLGIGLIFLGLLLGANLQKGKNSVSVKWLIFALGCFSLQILALSLIQWRCLLFACKGPEHLLIPFTVSEQADVWFMPGQFGAALALQGIIFLFNKSALNKQEMIFGSLGGLANGITTCLLLFATKWALPFEKSILFPCFAAGTIILCNLWASQFYKEKFNFSSNIACSLGIFIASL